MSYSPQTIHTNCTTNFEAVPDKLEQDGLDTEKDYPQSCIGYRHLVVVLGSIGYFMINSQRLSLAIAMVKMVNRTTYLKEVEENISFVSCPAYENLTNITSEQVVGGDFNWDTEQQGIIFAASIFGLAFGSLLFGRLAERYGAKWMLFGGNLFTSFCTLFSPFAAWYHFNLMGLVSTVTFVSLANWSPRNERAFLSSIVITGYPMGSLLSGVISGFICDHPSLGWPFVFYIFGGIGILYSILFALLYFETPKHHPKISRAEMQYIVKNQESDMAKRRRKAPWRNIMTSLRFYALLIAITGKRWTMLYFLTVHPQYLTNVLQFSIRDNGLVCSLPTLLDITGTWIASYLSDWILRKKYLSVTMLRKTFLFAGTLGCSLCLLGVYFANCDQLVNVIFFAAALFCMGVTTPGITPVCVDMAPKFSGTLQGLVTFISNTLCSFLPVIVGALIIEQSITEWHTVFFILIAAGMTSSTVFVIWGSANVQPWNFSVENLYDDSGGKVSHQLNSDESEKCLNVTV